MAIDPNIRKASPYPSFSTNEAVEELLEKMMYHLYHANPDLQERIAAGYRQNFGVEFNPALIPGRVRPLYLHGAPGHGKTAAVEEAVKRFCALVGLNYVKDPSVAYQVKPNDFVLSVHELGGEVSNVSSGGIPHKEFMSSADAREAFDIPGVIAAVAASGADVAGFQGGSLNMVELFNAAAAAGVDLKQFETDSGKQVAYMNKILMPKFHQMRAAAGGLLLADDFANATHIVQGSWLSVAQKGTYQGVLDLPNVYVVFTGNYGHHIDGAAGVNAPGEPILTRCTNIDVSDRMDDWLGRRERVHGPGNVADEIVVSFLNSHPDCFNQKETARMWSGLLEELRMKLHRYEGAMQFDLVSEKALSKARDSLLKGDAGSGAGESGDARVAQQAGRIARYVLRAAEAVLKRASASDAPNKLQYFVYDLLTSADPLARLAIEKGDLHEKRIQKQAGMSVGAESLGFQHQFGARLAVYTAKHASALFADAKSVADIEKDSAAKAKLFTYFDRYVNALAYLSNGPLEKSVLHFNQEMAAKVPSLAQDYGQKGKEAKLIGFEFQKLLTNRLVETGDKGKMPLNQEQVQAFQYATNIGFRLNEKAAMKSTV